MDIKQAIRELERLGFVKKQTADKTFQNFYVKNINGIDEFTCLIDSKETLLGERYTALSLFNDMQPIYWDVVLERVDDLKDFFFKSIDGVSLTS